MDENSTTDAANNQAAADTSVSTDTSTDSNASTDEQTANNGDNLNTSDSTDTTSADDGSKTTDENSSNETTSAPKFDTDLDQWAEKTGRPVPTNDSERSLLQEVRDGQREFTRQKQAKEAAKGINDAANESKPDTQDEDYADPLEKNMSDLEKRLNASETLRLRSEYVSEKGVTLEESNAMGAILKEKVEKAAAISPEKGKAAFDFWTDPANLEDWHTLAKAKLSTAGGTDTSSIEQAAAQRERERIARESKANGPARTASTASTGAKTEDQKRLERFSNWD